MKLRSVQMLRGVAALLVVLFHLRVIRWSMIQSMGEAAVPAIPLIENGYAGVDLFFVISGFIMVYVTGNRSTGLATAGGFLAARAWRIYPPWWLFAGLFTAYMLVAHVGLNSSGLGWQAIGEGTPPAEYLWKSFALVPQAKYPILNVGWTLIHEMYFYLVFALSLLVARRWLPVILALWAVSVAGLALAGYSTPIGGTLLSLAVHPMTLEFIMGGFAGLAVCSGRRWQPGLLAALSIVLFLAALALTLPATVTATEADATFGPFARIGHQFIWQSDGAWSLFMLEWGRVIAFGLPAATLVYALASLEAEGRLPILKPLEALGDWSYSLYLSHILILAGAARVLPKIAEWTGLADLIGFTSPSLTGTVVFCAIGLVATVAYAALTYRYYERPLIRLFSRTREQWFSAHKVRLQPALPAARIW